MSEQRPSPFHCGTQVASWRDRNCCCCTKDYKEATSKTSCDIEKAIANACFHHGRVSADIGRRMGYDPEVYPPFYTWDCPERDMKEPRDE